MFVVDKTLLGVFYPLQTFSKNIPLDLKKVPFCISALDKSFENTLLEVANSISNNVYPIDEIQRKILHLALNAISSFVFHQLDKHYLKCY